MIPPILNVDIRFLVQFTDGRGRHLASPQSLSNILHTPHEHAGQIHLNESFFHTAFPAAVPLNDASLKRHPFELGHLEGNIPGSGGEVTAVVAATVVLALFVTLMPGRLGQLPGLQQFVQRFLYAASYQRLELPLDYFLI